MSQFNLIDERWIPVRYPDGSREELGISDALLKSREIAAIVDPSPLVVAALHRFLLAFLYRALQGPTDIQQARDLFLNGIPTDTISAYLKNWHHRFWLFDEKYPFGQNPYIADNQVEPWTKLTAEFNATTNKVLFDHTDTRTPGSRKPQECARWLIATMSFSISGGRGYYPSPSPNAIMCIPLGRTLHETLCFNLVPYPNRNVMELDSASWEQDPPGLPLTVAKKQATGYADRYSWLARMIYLEELPSGEVARMRFAPGFGFESTSDEPDPMQPYRIVKDKGRLPVQFNKERGTWRDFDSLLPDKDGLAPQTIKNAAALAGANNDLCPRSILSLGMRYTPPNANVDFWRMENFSLPEAFVSNSNFRNDLHEILSDAEESAHSLWDGNNGIKGYRECSIGLFAMNILSRGDRYTASDSNKLLSDIKQFYSSTNVVQQFWSSLEIGFHEILQEYALDKDSDEIRCQWLKTVRTALQKAWQQHCASIAGGDAWTIRALIKSEWPVQRKLKELDEEIRKYEPHEEVA